MALKIVVPYKETELVYNVIKQEEDVYCLRMSGQEDSGRDYLPQKIIIRKKGKIWIWDAEDYPEPVARLTAEVKPLSVTKEMTTDE